MTARHMGIQKRSTLSGWIARAVGMSRDLGDVVVGEGGLSIRGPAVGAVVVVVGGVEIDTDDATAPSSTTIAPRTFKKTHAPSTPPSTTSTPFAIPVPNCTSPVPGHAPVAAMPSPMSAPPSTLPS